jgi:type VI secretion system protein ImpM
MTVAWHGKLPSTGDFVSRRLDDAQRAWLDAWLAALMQRLRQRGDDAWLAAYLASPSWRFLWLPQAAPLPWQGSAWVGVLMPSVDRAGRYYPLLLLHALDAWPWQAAEREALWAWLGRLDDIAASALHDDWTIEALEASLLRLGEPPSGAEALPTLEAGRPSLRRIGLSADGPAGGFAAEAAACWAHAVRDRCYWYGAAEGEQPSLLVSDGLHDAALADALLGMRRAPV